MTENYPQRDRGKPQQRITTGSALRFAVRLVVTAVFFGVIFWKIDFRSILERLRDVQAFPLACAGVLLGVQFLASTWRWKKVTDYVSARAIHFSCLSGIMGASHLYGQLLPSTVGGDLVRVAMLGRQIGLASATFSVLIDRITGLVVLVALTVVSLPVLAGRVSDTVAVASFVALALGSSLVLAVFLLLPARLPPTWLPRTGAPWLSLAARSRAALTAPTLAPAVVGGGIAVHLGAVALIYLLAAAVKVPLSFVDCVLLVPPALLVASVPISIAGWGVREGALAGAFSLVGVPTADIVTISILYGLTAPAIGVIYGVIALMGSLVSSRFEI